MGDGGQEGGRGPTRGRASLSDCAGRRDLDRDILPGQVAVPEVMSRWDVSRGPERKGSAHFGRREGRRGGNGEVMVGKDGDVL